MGLSNLIDRLFKRGNSSEEKTPESLFNHFDDDSIQEAYHSSVEEGYDPMQDPVRLALNVPEILPCAFDQTIQFWLKRIQFWGKLDITYTDPEGRKSKVGVRELESAFTQPEEMIRIFGKWGFKKKSFNSFEAFREFKDLTGRKRIEKFAVVIELDKDLKNAINGKF